MMFANMSSLKGNVLRLPIKVSFSLCLDGLKIPSVGWSLPL